MEIPIIRDMSLVVMIIMIIAMIFFQTSPCSCQDPEPLRNCSSSCGDIRNITFPFRLENDPPQCGNPLNHFEFYCCDNTTRLGSWVVQAINYDNHTIRLREPQVQQDNCSSIPSISTKIDFYVNLFQSETSFSSFQTKCGGIILFLSCEKPVLKNPSYIDTSPCINSSALSPYNNGNNYSYAVYANGFKFSDLEESCQVYHSVFVSSPAKGEARKYITSYKDIHKEFVYGVEISWVKYFLYDGWYVDAYSNKFHCSKDSRLERVLHWMQVIQEKIGDACYYSTTCVSLANRLHIACKWTVDRLLREMGTKITDFWLCVELQFVVMLLTPRTVLGISFVIGLIIYKWRRRHLSLYTGIEEFLQSHNNLMPIRYSYSEVRKMTEGFKTKLGEGGFGSVYKGKLRSGRFAAIKMLGKSKASGVQDFMNEVATIGRIHHVNVVRMTGFCAEGSKRALIFDFMPNGSLDKHIFLTEGTSCSLSYDKIFEISLGIARGIEYLHRGCDMQILHFDIKPHNILLDENFSPKISDFGLARQCPLDNSIVSLTAVRGTIGYIAPELFYRNIGGVSHKADVYSFGMLMMEMANRRKNLNANAENSSQIYFPFWIYDQFNEGNNLEIEDSTEEELKMMKKMIIVGLWCIQLKPCGRPSMRKAIEMLETDVESLQMPPKPCLYPQENHNNGDEAESSNTTCSSTPEEGDSTEATLISKAI